MTKKQIISTIIFGILFCIGLYDFIPNLKKPQQLAEVQGTEIQDKKDSLQKKRLDSLLKKQEENLNPDPKKLIEQLTDEKAVVYYVKRYKELPAYYVTKEEARKQGWRASEGNLCEILPGRAIGGDKFGNRERKLPLGEQYFEADINYKCGRRNADRIIFNKKGEVWVTKDHYKTFEKK